MRELTIKITADGKQARSELGGVEKAVQGVETAAGQTDKAIATMGVNTRKVVAGIAGALAAANIGAEAKKAVDATSRIADSAARLGIGAEAVQRLGFALEQGGSSLEALNVGLGRMSAFLTDGTKQGVALLQQMGLDLDKLRAMKPEDAFVAIAEGIRQIPDPLRQSAAAMDIFGRGGAEMLPAIKAGIADIGAQAPVMSAAMIESGDRVGDNLEKITLRINNLKAQALLPLMDTFAMLPESVQIGAAGLLTFMPSVETLILGVLALGGPTGALAALKAAALGVGTFFSATLPGLFAGAITFFTTTLPAAFSAVIAFLGPAGLIALAVIGLVAVWVKWGDDIKRIVRQVYEAIKSYLVDKFNAIVASVKGLIQSVGDKFKWLYDVTIGNSYVPDMIEGIDREFGRLPDVMVRPTERATRTAGQYFRDFARESVRVISDAFGDMLTGAVSFKDGFIGIWRGVQSLLGDILSDIINNQIRGWLSGMLGEITGAKPAFHQAIGGLFGGGGGQGSAGSFGGNFLAGLGGGLAGLATNLIGAGIGALSDKFRGGEEALQVNPRRDAFLLQFGPPGTGPESGFHSLAALLHSLGRHDLFEVLTSRNKLDEFQRAEQLIADLLGRNGMGGIQVFERGGMVQGIGPQMAVVHGGERVLNRTEAAAFNRNDGRGDVHLHGDIVIQGANKSGKELAEEMVRELPNAWRRGRGRNAARIALGVA